jgi:hypothetical protein
MRRGGWGTNVNGPGWTVINRPQLQRWFVPYTLLFGLVFGYGVHDMLTTAVWSGNWEGAVFFAIPVSCVGYIVVWLLMWRGLAIFAFGPDRLLVRTWIGNMLNRPPRVYMLTPDLRFTFRLIWGLSIDTSTERFMTIAQYFPSTEMRRLIDVATARGIPIEYGWKPDFMSDIPRKPRWQRWLGL